MKILTFYLAIFFTLIFTSASYSQSYYNAELIFTNGDSKAGYAQVPDGAAKKVNFKGSLDDKPVKYMSDELYTITFNVENGESYTIERGQVRTLVTMKNGEIYSRINKAKGWFFRNNADEKLNFYSAGQKYKINAKGDFIIVSKGQTGFAGIGYYFKRPSEEALTYITAKMSGFQVSHEKSFRNAASTYFDDDKALADRIKNDEFKSNQILEIYKIYISGL